MNASAGRGSGERRFAVYGFAEHVEQSAERFFPDGDLDAFTRRGNAHSSGQPVRFRQDHGAHGMPVDVLLHFHDFNAVFGGDGKSVQDRRKFDACGKANVDDGSGNFKYYARIHFASVRLCLAPAVISVISPVIAACLAR